MFWGFREQDAPTGHGRSEPQAEETQSRLTEDHGGMDKVADAIKWLMKLGRRWRPMIRAGLAPINCAAWVKSSSRRASSFERTERGQSNPKDPE